MSFTDPVEFSVLASGMRSVVAGKISSLQPYLKKHTIFRPSPRAGDIYVIGER
jgi:hypothetical protein